MLPLSLSPWVCLFFSDLNVVLSFKCLLVWAVVILTRRTTTHIPRLSSRRFSVLLIKSPSTKYLGIYLDKHLTWKDHIRKKRKQIDLKIKDMYWIIGRKSLLSLENKILLYKTIIKPIWTYGVEIWGCASKSNISIIQRSQSKILRMIANAPWYVSNITLHEDLNVPLVNEVIKQRSTIYHNTIEGHENILLQPLLQPHNHRRLQRIWPADLREG
jgi:hypothetical protein